MLRAFTFSSSPSFAWFLGQSRIQTFKIVSTKTGFEYKINVKGFRSNSTWKLLLFILRRKAEMLVSCSSRLLRKIERKRVIGNCGEFWYVAWQFRIAFYNYRRCKRLQARKIVLFRRLKISFFFFVSILLENRLILFNDLDVRLSVYNLIEMFLNRSNPILRVYIHIPYVF